MDWKIYLMLFLCKKTIDKQNATVYNEVVLEMFKAVSF
ncbi:hypothetical protein X842_2769 [Listeria monocytogenes Lm_1880]|nr:hypothetical protein X842_2769 [Listeria monocytogenes Lm_1880]QBZ19290.1 hypothetical protein FORC68_2062 [Listeria monocytogenes]